MSPTALDAALANSLRAIEDGERETPRDRWDPAFVAAALGSDPQRIFRWVQANTFWIPYRGLLRGPIGVLMDRLGNSLDRAGLLATLLRQSGRPVRLARGTLSHDAAVAMIPVLLRARYASASRGPGTQSAPDVAAISAQYHLDEPSVRRVLAGAFETGARRRTQLLARIPDQARRLAMAVGSRPDDLSSTALARAIEAAQDHWWVQVLERGTWQDFDLTRPGVPGARAPAQQTISIDAFPEQLRHRITVRVIAEQWASGALTERVALQNVLRPSQLIGTPIALRFVPSKWPEDFPPPNMTAEQGLRSLALDQHEWTPALVVGKNPVVQFAMRDTGEVAPPRSAAQELGGSVGGKMGGFARALDDALGGPATPPARTAPAASQRFLTAAWIEYQIDRPGERPQTIRRAVFDLVGPAARSVRPAAAPRMDQTSLLSRGLALMREVEILPVVCRFVPEYATHLAAQSLLANRAVLSNARRPGVPDDFPHVQQLMRDFAPMPTPLYGLALARFEWSRVADGLYLDEPNILTRHTFFTPAATTFKLQMATDIVANNVGVDFLADNPFERRLEQGVFDTNAEAILASQEPNASNAGWAFTGSGSWTTLRSPADPQLSALPLSNDVRRLIAADLEAGYVVIAPRTPVVVGRETFSGWWRVDPKTGHALGIGATGLGADFLEYLITVVLSAELTAFFYFFFCRLNSGSIAACRASAIEAGIIVLLLALLEFLSPAFGFGWKGGGSGGLPPGADPFAKTEPGLPPPETPFAKTEPGLPPGAGAPPGGGAPGGGAPGGGPGSSPPDIPNWSRELTDATDRYLQAQNRADALQGTPGWEAARDAAIDALKKVRGVQLKEAGVPPLYDPFGLGAGPGGSGPASSPASPTAPTLPGTGPNGTQIIPPDLGSAPTLPGTGPNGTQIIPPGCPPNCPPSPGGKSGSGFGALLNALGQKGGS